MLSAPCCAWPTPQLINPSSKLLLSCTAMHPQPLPVLRAPYPILPVTAPPQSGHLSHPQAVSHHIPISLPSCWQVLMSLQDTVSRHNLALPSPVSPLPDTKPMATQCFEVRIGDTVWPWCLCHPCVGTDPGTPLSTLQVKVGKSQRAALTVDVEEGTVTITKRGGGSPEEVIPQDKSKRLLTSVLRMRHLLGWA